MSLVHLVDVDALHVAVNTKNNFKGSIYMVFDYADHDLTGLMERHGKAGFAASQVGSMLLAQKTAAAWHAPYLSAHSCSPRRQSARGHPT